MCGITGFLNFDREHKADHIRLKDMTNVLSHRGPDGEGYWVSGPMAMKHRRLSIIDLRTGVQPIVNEAKKITLIFNGEIYNYIELRDELASLGHFFRTTSDTEVLLRAYEEWGVELHSRLNGMWAFAIWDGTKQRLLLSRDRIGEKPLHYSVFNNETFIFGSEIKSLLAYGLPRAINTDLIEIYLSLGYIPAPFSFYKDIKKLMPGHYLLVENGFIKNIRYWDLPEIDENDVTNDKARVNSQFQEILGESVKIRMRSDVKFGAFLSGGLDSSCIVALMSKISDKPVETFTVGFDNNEFDERLLAREVAQHFKTNHHEQVMHPDALQESIATIRQIYDEPFGDSSALPTGQVSRFAAKSVKMVLTGDGGDEALSGYNGYQSEKFGALYGRIPSFLRKVPESVLAAAAKIAPRSSRYNLARIRNVLALSGKEFLERLFVKASWADPVLIRAIVRPVTSTAIRFDDFLSDFMKNCSYQDGFYRLMYFNFKLSLPDDMLVKVDRMSMSCSLETRLPFLDHRLIEYLVPIHKNIKMNRYERKSILRNTIGKKLPPRLMKARKKGFVVPLREWFQDDRLAMFTQERLGKSKLGLERDIIDRIFHAHKSGQNDYGNFLWMLLVLDACMGGETL